MKKFILLFSLILLSISCSRKITCDKFIVNTSLQDDKLLLSIDSDLPDFTDILVTVSRSYWQKGNTHEYSFNYSYSIGENRMTINRDILAKWKNPQSISLDETYWISKLKDRQERMDFYSDLNKISDSISVKVEVPINQSNPKFGKFNIDLVGNEVTNSHTILKEKVIHYPLSNKKELIESKLDKIILHDIPKETTKNYLFIDGRVNPKYSLFINNKKVKLKDTSDKFSSQVDLKDGINTIPVKLLSSSSKCVYRKNITIEYLNPRTKYIENCKAIDFRYLKKNPNKYIGTQVKFKGKVIEIVENNNGAVITLAIEDGYKYYNYSHRLYVITKGSTRYIVEDDVIEAYGRIIGDSNNITWDNSPIMMMEHCYHHLYGKLF